MTQKHRNVPIFIPHLGCPHLCVFCNQNSISGARFEEEKVKNEIEQVLSTISDGAQKPQIAFFGGSFTGIDRDLMKRLLDLAETFVQAGRVDSIRFSTRPDYLSEEIFEIISAYSVKNIELGLQSFSDEVLTACERGHTAECAKSACKAVVAHGYELTGQMMIGLPGSDQKTEIETAEEICRLGAISARIYPTVVFFGTKLAKMTEEGKYQPLSVEEAVERSAACLRVFDENRVDCIRIGLCSGENLTDPKKVMAGPNHPALGEMVRSELYYDRLVDQIKRRKLPSQEVILKVPKKEVSLCIGQKRNNLKRLLREQGVLVVRVEGTEDDAISVLPATKKPLGGKETCI